MAGLRAILSRRRRTSWPIGWRVLARSVVREHPVLDLIHESPLSREIFGQAFDARVDPLAIASNISCWPRETSELGRRIAMCELEGETFKALRARRAFLDRTRRSDIVVCAEALDALGDAPAANLIAATFSQMGRLGRLSVASISPSVSDRAYVEACMDVWLSCRDESALRHLTATIPPDEIAEARTSRDATGLVVCLDLVHA